MRVANLKLVVVCVAVIAGAGCKKRDPVVVAKIVVNAPRQLDDDQEEKDAIRARVETLVKRTPGVTVDSSDSNPTHFLQVRIGDVFSEPVSGGVEYRQVAVVLRARGEGRSYRVEGMGDGPDKLTESVVAGFEDGWRLITRQRQANAKGESAYLDLLSNSDWRLREFALDQISANRVTKAVPVLCEALLTEPLAVLQLRIIGVLTELRDRRAVGPLIELTRNQRAGLLLHVLHALGVIGGREAEAFLVTVAGGHSIEGVRSVATQIIGDMQAGRDVNRH